MPFSLLGNLNLTNTTLDEVMYAGQMFNEYYMMNSTFQIGGLSFVTDCQGISRSEIMKMNDPESSKKNLKYFQVKAI